MIKIFFIASLVIIPSFMIIYTLYYEHELEEESNINNALQEISWNFDRILSNLDFTALFELFYKKLEGKIANVDFTQKCANQINQALLNNLKDVKIMLNKHAPRHAIYIFFVNPSNEVSCLWHKNNLFPKQNILLMSKFKEFVELITFGNKILKHENLQIKAYILQNEFGNLFNLLLPIKVQYDREGKFQICRNINGKTYGFIWKKLSNKQIYVCTVLNLQEDEKIIISNLLLAFWNEENVGLALLPKSNNNPKFSNNFDKFSLVKKFIINQFHQYKKIVNQEIKYLDNNFVVPILYAPNFSYNFIDSFIVSRHNKVQNLPYHIILTTYCKKIVFFNKKFFQLFFIIAICLYFIINIKSLINYLEYLSFVKIMLFSFLFVAVLPLSVLNYFLYSSSNLKVNLYIKNLESKLIKHINGLDELVKINISKFVELIKSFTLDQFYPNLSSNSVITSDLASKIENNMIQKFEELDKKGLFHISLFLAYDKFGNRYKIYKPIGKKYHKFETDTPLAIKFKKKAEKIFKTEFDTKKVIALHSNEPLNDSVIDTLEGVKIEILRDALYQLGGIDTYLKTLYTPYRLFELKFFYNSNFMIQTPMYLGNKIYLLGFWFWDRASGDKKLLQFALHDKLQPYPLDDEKSIFINGYIGPRHSITSIIDNKMFKDLSPIPALTEMIYSTFQTRISNKKMDYTNLHKPILYTVVSKSFPGIWAGAISTRPIEAIKHFVFISRMAWLVSIFLLAISIAYVAAFSFIRPIKKLISIANYIRLGNYEVKIDILRDDEIGNLANTFNNLLVALREGKILKRYVSKSVLQKISSSLEQIRAGVGDRTHATIVFCSIYKFNEISKTLNPEETFNLINAHLEIISYFTRKFGGEIDKIIGDKVMIVFYHSDFEDGGKEAIINAINVIKSAKSEWYKRKYPSTIVAGINTGEVISGIIGATNRKLEYTVIGDPVNLASRLNDLSKQIEKPMIFISGSSYKFIQDLYNVTRIPITSIRGKTQQVDVYALS